MPDWSPEGGVGVGRLGVDPEPDWSHELDELDAPDWSHELDAPDWSLEVVVVPPPVPVPI